MEENINIEDLSGHRTSASRNNILISDDGFVATIYHPNSGFCFYVSSIDLDRVMQYGWTICKFPGKNFKYVTRTTEEHRTEFLHHFIMKEYCDLSNPNLQIDHIDRNPCNNTRNNLRLVSQRFNNLNKYNTDNNINGVYGVKRNIGTNGNVTYSANIKINGSSIALGTFADKYDAALVYDSFIYNQRPEYEYDATNIRNNKIPQEILDEYNIKDIDNIPYIASCNTNIGSNYHRVCKSRNKFCTNIRLLDNSYLVKRFDSEIEAAAYVEQYLLDHPELQPINKNNIIWSEDPDKINIAGIILTKAEMEEKTRGY